MRGLLDTHTFLWFVGDAPELPLSVKATIEDPENDASVRMASFWEIGIKASIGKLPRPVSLFDKNFRCCERALYLCNS